MNLLDALLVTALVVSFAPPLLLGAALLFGRPASERRCELAADVQSVLLLLLGAALAAAFYTAGGEPHEVRLPAVLEVEDYGWHPVFLLDTVSVAYFSLVALVYPAIVRFSMPAFHREPGAARYWFLVTLLAFSLFAASLAGNIDMLYVGWELVGLCSVNLIAFFRHNARACENSLRALIYYRLCDAGLLGATVWIHHAFPAADFLHFGEDASVSSAPIVGLLLLFGSLAKSAQLPMSPWLHRAMEGPAASSAIFYGALSVHLGPLLLLRTHELWHDFWIVRAACISCGAATAVYASLVGRTRPDAKTSIAYAAMAQLGIIYVEIGLGWHRFALVHLWAHAGLRTWQFLRSSSLIQDFQNNPLVGTDVRLRVRSGWWARFVPVAWQRKLHLAAVRLFWLDALQWRLVAKPCLALCGALASLEDLVLRPDRRGRS